MRVASLQSASTGGGAREVALLLELAPDLEQAVLGVLDQHEPLRAHARDLAAQLGADRAAGAGHEHDRGRAGRRRPGRSPRARARGRARPRPAPRAPGASGSRRRTSSSKMVGSVRTGMPRSRHAVTTCWRSVPGADGIAMITSSGSTPSRTRGSSRGRAEHLEARDAHALLARVVVDEADRRAARAPGLRRSSNATCWPPLPAPTISTSARRALEDAPRDGRSTIAAHERSARRRRTRA